MTLRELKAKATASELTLIDRVEALVNAACDTEQIRADAATKVRDELRKIAEKVQSGLRGDYSGRFSESELLGRAVHQYLKENQ